jgi:6-phosphogluconolactonase
VRAKGLKVITSSVADTQAAACWLVVSNNGKYAYAANAASGTISGYQVGKKGELSLLRSDGINGNTGSGSHPIDMAFNANNHFLYVLASGNSTINIFRIIPDSSLSSIASVAAPSSIASGLAAE